MFTINRGVFKTGWFLISTCLFGPGDTGADYYYNNLISNIINNITSGFVRFYAKVAVKSLCRKPFKKENN